MNMQSEWAVFTQATGVSWKRSLERTFHLNISMSVAALLRLPGCLLKWGGKKPQNHFKNEAFVLRFEF